MRRYAGKPRGRFVKKRKSYGRKNYKKSYSKKGKVRGGYGGSGRRGSSEVFPGIKVHVYGPGQGPSVERYDGPRKRQRINDEL